MEILRIRTLRGPNVWSPHRSIEALVSCKAGSPEFAKRLRTLFPKIGPLDPEGSEAHALAVAALALQAQAGCRVAYLRTAKTRLPWEHFVVVEYSEEKVGRLAMERAVELCRAALDDVPFDPDAAIAELSELDEDIRLGPSTGSIVNAAIDRGVPYFRLTEGSLVQFGWGFRQRRIQAAETDGDGAIAENIAQDKDLTKELLDAAGVPVPHGRVVQDAEDAWLAACEIGGPVVVKPRDGNQGKGIAVNVSAREDVVSSFHAASKVSREVIVERFVPGSDYRLLVIGSKLVAAARRDPPHVIGDGKRTVRELVHEVNLDPRRGSGHATSLTRIPLDEIALATLARQGLEAGSVPEKGRRVALRNNANLSTGGSATDVTGEVHPEVAARAIDAARMVGLDICGVDMVCREVQIPLEEQGGAVVEVNAAPGLRMHLSPSYGKGRPVGEAAISTLFPDGSDGRIPLVAVTGTNGKTTTVRLISRFLEESGFKVGMTTTDGVYVGDRKIDSGDCSGPKSAKSVLMEPDVEAAVCGTARGGIRREGLAFDLCDVAVVTNLGMGDHLGLSQIENVEDLARVKQTVVKALSPQGTAVLNAGDPLVAAMAEGCRGSVLYFCSDPHHPLLVSSRAMGRKVLFPGRDGIHAACGSEEHFFPWEGIPLARGGTIPFQVENAMAAIGAAWALGIEWKRIAAGLAGFESDAGTTPGRFNFFDYRGATLIADYGHNADAMIALVKAVKSMPAKRRIVVISGAGDRRDEDIRMQTGILGELFDEAILYEDQCQRGRADGEVLSLLRSGFSSASRTSKVSEIRGEFAAIDLALSRLSSGDLCLILVDQVEEALAHIASAMAA